MSVSMGASVDRRRRATILAGSLLLHAALLAWLALPTPPLLLAAAPDPLRTMTVELQRRVPLETQKPRATPAAASTPARPQPLRARPTRAPVPAGTPTVEMPATGMARPGVAIRPAPLPGDAAGDLRTALRSSAAGCVSADAVGLNRQERERCEERFGAAKAKGDPL